MGKHHHHIKRQSSSDCPNQNADKPKMIRPKSKSKPASAAATSVYLASFVLAVAIVAYFGYVGYLETRVITPLSAPKVVEKSGLAVPDRFWGSYRPGVYFGMKTRSPRDVLAGLMWFIPEKVDRQNLGLRHWCEQGDNLQSYGWIRHDGIRFGDQLIRDRGLNISTVFVKKPGGDHGGDWSARIRVEGESGGKKTSSSVALMFYLGLDEEAEGQLKPENVDLKRRRISSIRGKTQTLGDFRMKFVDRANDGKKLKHFFVTAESPTPAHFTDSVMRSLRLFEKNSIGLESADGKAGNLVVYQVTSNELPFELDVVFESDGNTERKGELSDDALSSEIESQRKDFDEKFEDKFGLREKGFNDDEIGFARAAVSNMIGGIGYFYGQSLVKSDMLSSPVPYWEAPLYTAVPSRSFFPRGFLWDEGFHNLLVSKWNPRISADILGHWMDLINVEGWIPREQILGPEARVKVPDEYVVQHNSNANPPTLLLTLHSMMESGETRREKWFHDFLLRMWPRLQVWYDWFDNTQQGEVPGTYRWRGRNSTTSRELNPKTLTSGLDDFPRASHPSVDERHLDLRCWMALASALMADIAAEIGKDPTRYSQTADFLSDNALLDAAHWSQQHAAFLDFGLHTEHVKLERPRRQHPNEPKRDKVRVVLKEPQLQYVNQQGYVGLFPFILQLLNADSPRIPAILDAMMDPERLFTPFGLRSLSKSASLYDAKNTEHDPPYWRSPIWINVNFLAVRALKHYSTVEGPHQERAEQVYQKLRSALIGNVIKEYKRTGYIWEQYNDKTGHGQGCRPFTGWSALVVLMMGETY